MQVGSTVATAFGPAIVTALRAADNKLEVSFPWSSQSSLSPDVVLGPGQLVKCGLLGVGVIRSTDYTRGFCHVRFPFGVGIVLVEHIRLETSSIASRLRYIVLQSPLRVGDRVVTPFGCGTVLRRRGSVLMVDMSLSQSSTLESVITAFVQVQQAALTF
ncbi:TPA: hypothetical protein N0F65_012628 [Lagenidium giganteum]|uniref:Uncharacterized protein n=1 Tax=Lagenidium giganteum TaxID=4803 RepID=A0AAV2YLP8_9STRA|nr:TPA: hypothetical protein N0F65_012628 [Lagenidium giganteum]